MTKPKKVDEPEKLGQNAAQSATMQATRLTVDTGYLDPDGYQTLTRQLNLRFGDHSADLHKSSANPFGASDKEFNLKHFLEISAPEVFRKKEGGTSMGLAWKDLCVLVKELGPAGAPTMGNLASSILHYLRPSSDDRAILHNVQGFVRPGEMLLVLGRPGSGCSTLLKTLALHHEEYEDVQGTLVYQGLTPDQVRSHHRGDVVYCAEDDMHFPTLTVRQTLTFAATSRTPQDRHLRHVRLDEEQGLPGTRAALPRKEWAQLLVEVICTVLGLRPAFDTLVGNDFIRGISGGQRKRVSIAESIAGGAKVTLFDNSSRGLDSKSTLEFVTAVRVAADTINTTSVAAIYQAGEQATELFDRVLLLNQGYQVFFGRLDEAVDHFETLGFRRQALQTTADYLVACTHPPEAILLAAEGSDATNLPLSPKQQQRCWESSDYYVTAARETDRYLQSLDQDAQFHEKALRQASSVRHAKTQRKTSNYLVSPPVQIKLAVQRRLQIMNGDRVSQIVPLGAAIFQALITASVYTKLVNTTAGFFSRGGVIFFSILYSCLTSMSEVGSGYTQKPIIIRQADFAFIHPWADAAAMSLIDIPLRLLQVFLFDVIIYFMSGLSYSADQFFLFLATTYLSALTLTSFFRFLAAALRAESQATMVAGLVVLDLVLYAGYSIPRKAMVVWWKWLSFSNPISFAFEVLMTNEFRRLRVPCAQLVPSGPGYENVSTANQVCPISGAAPGQTIVNGAQYLRDTYGYAYGNTTRNMFILLAFYVFFTSAYCVATEHSRNAKTTASSPLRLGSTPSHAGGEPRATSFASDKSSKDAVGRATAASRTCDEGVQDTKADAGGDRPLFWWKDLCYDVPAKGGQRRLLKEVSGFVAPGKITALMGSSGAGKTTLLNVLAGRVDTGIVSGDIKIDHADRSPGFQRSTGYCQQQDVHLETQTVREALEFSALLRQPASINAAEKLAYVDEVMDTMGLTPFSNVVIGDVGTSLDIEQRKRLTICVELVARPALLLFLDEPTSGLDSVAASSIMKLLRKIADTGQAILCTIHQPSAQLFSSFDRLLLLQAGGETVYFGDVGDNAQNVLAYFELHSGKRCPARTNPADFMLELLAGDAQGSSQAPQDWHVAYIESELPSQCDAAIEAYLSRASTSGSFVAETDDVQEFAATRGSQYWLTTRRLIRHYWRSPTYIVSKLMLNALAGLFVGSSFWNAGGKDEYSTLQNCLFSVFMAVMMASPLAQQIQPLFIHHRNIFVVREGPSKMFSWKAMVLSQVLVEIPWNILGGTLFWLPWYYMVGFQGSSRAVAIMWGFLQIFELFFSSLGLAMASFAPNSMIASVLYSTLFSFMLLFCGVSQPKSQMPSFWSSWMFPLSPFTYLIEGMVALALHQRPVRCTEAEVNIIVPPAGQSCQAFLGRFSVSLDNVANADPGARGYFTQLVDGTCSFCSARVGDDYLRNFDYTASHIYRNLVILSAYVFFNIFLYFALFYLVWIFKGTPSGISRAVKRLNKRVEALSSRAKGPSLSHRTKTGADLPVSGLLGGSAGINTGVQDNTDEYRMRRSVDEDDL